jgi:hypothetical protein
MSHGWSADGAAGKEARACKKGDGSSPGCEANDYRASCETCSDNNQRFASRENGNDHN